jgi:hypothetical protein
VNLKLWVVKNADANTDTENAPGEDAAVEITQSTRLDTITALTTAVTTNKGKVLKLVTLNDLEKLPTLVEDRLVQSSGAGDETVPSEAANFIEAQNLISQFRVYSGPNVHSEEGADPYAWVICGTRGTVYGEHMCDNVGGALDSSGAEYAIVYNSNNQNGTLGDSVLARFGRDLNPNLPDPNQQAGVYVACGAGGAGCISDPGADRTYGTADDGTIYYREAQENGLRGWIRETNGHTFSFLGADNDGTHNGASPGNFGLTQLMTQETEGFLMSCLNCSPHSIPVVVETVFYNLDWPAVPTSIQVPHPPTNARFSIVP